LESDPNYLTQLPNFLIITSERVLLNLLTVPPAYLMVRVEILGFDKIGSTLEQKAAKRPLFYYSKNA
jgi:hypothetical protein